MAETARSRRSVALESAAQRYLSGQQEAERAAKDLFDQLWPGFVRYFVHHRVPLGEAQELASDTLLRIFQAMHQLRSVGSFQKWAYTVAHNSLLNHLRDTRSQHDHEQELDEEQWQLMATSWVDAGQSDAVTRLCLERQMRQFTADHPQRAKVLELGIVEGWSLEELSVALGRTVAATKEYLSQCRKCLRRYLLVCLDFDPGKGVA